MPRLAPVIEPREWCRGRLNHDRSFDETRRFVSLKKKPEHGFFIFGNGTQRLVVP